MRKSEKDVLIEKVKNLPDDAVAKVLIFMAGLEAGAAVDAENKRKGIGEAMETPDE